MLPALEHLEQGGPAVGREAARCAGDGTEQRLAALDHPEGDEIPHLLHAGQPVRGLVQHLGVTDHRAHTLVGEVGDEQREPFRLDDRVGVDEDADLAARAADPLGHPGALAPVFGEPDADDLRVALARREHPLPGRVGRAVVEHDDLEPVGRVVARQAGVDRRLDAALFVEGGNHDRAGGPVAGVGGRAVERREREPRDHVERDAERVGVEEGVVQQRRKTGVLGDPDPVDECDRVDDADELDRAGDAANEQRAVPARRQRRRRLVERPERRQPQAQVGHSCGHECQGAVRAERRLALLRGGVATGERRRRVGVRGASLVLTAPFVVLAYRRVRGLQRPERSVGSSPPTLLYRQRPGARSPSPEGSSTAATLPSRCGSLGRGLCLRRGLADRSEIAGGARGSTHQPLRHGGEGTMEAPAVTLSRPRAVLSSSILTMCSAPGCRVLTMGGTCVDHDPRDLHVYPRGRPFVREPAPAASS